MREKPHAVGVPDKGSEMSMKFFGSHDGSVCGSGPVTDLPDEDGMIRFYIWLIAWGIVVIIFCAALTPQPQIVKQRGMENYGYVDSAGHVWAGYKTKDEAVRRAYRSKALHCRFKKVNNPPWEKAQ